MKLSERIYQISEKHGFWSRVRMAGKDECWMWSGTLDRHGYGYIGRERVHRIAWEISRRNSLSLGSVVRHTCDTPACCNPAHLVLGTQNDNVADRVQRTRSARGTANGRAVLSDADALSIYHAPGNRDAIAARYGVSSHTVVDIKNGRTWKWLTKHQYSHGGNKAAGNATSAGVKA